MSRAARTATTDDNHTYIKSGGTFYHDERNCQQCNDTMYVEIVPARSSPHKQQYYTTVQPRRGGSKERRHEFTHQYVRDFQVVDDADVVYVEEEPDLERDSEYY